MRGEKGAEGKDSTGRKTHARQRIQKSKIDHQNVARSTGTNFILSGVKRKSE